MCTKSLVIGDRVYFYVYQIISDCTAGAETFLIQSVEKCYTMINYCPTSSWLLFSIAESPVGAFIMLVVLIYRYRNCHGIIYQAGILVYLNIYSQLLA